MTYRTPWRVIQLSIASPKFLLVKLQRTAAYWRTLAGIKNLAFRFERQVYGMHRWAKEKKEGAGIWGQVVFAVWRDAFFAVGIVVVLLALEWFVPKFAGWLTHAFPVWSVPFSQFADTLQRIIPSGGYSLLLSTVAQIGGVFLGLYFAAISVVISTSYARVPWRIRGLLMREKVGNRYIRFLALLTAVAVLLLAASLVGVRPGMITWLFVTFLSIVSVYSFVVLGLRVFQFFDPTTVSATAFEDVRNAMEAATVTGFAAFDASFQTHYQQQASEALATVRELVELCNEEKHLQTEAVQSIAAQLLHLVRDHAECKKRIPTNSRWFKFVPKHREWLLQDYTRVSVALSTGTPLEPDYVPDPLWFESDIAEILNLVLEGMWNRRDREGAYNVLSYARPTLEVLGASLGVQESLLIFRSLGTVVSNFVAATPIENLQARKLVGREITLTLALLDMYGLCLIATFLSWSRGLERWSPTELANAVAKINWRRPDTLYRQEFPKAVLPQLEELQRGLEFEIAVEGKAVSSSWYIRQLIALSLLRAIKEGLEEFFTELENTFVAQSGELSKQNQTVVYAAQHIQRGLESSSKMLTHFGTLRDRVSSLDGLRKAQDIPWPLFDWEKTKATVIRYHEQLVTTLAKCAIPIARLGRTEQLPDYFGQAYSILAQECYFSISTRKIDLYKKIYPDFFGASLLAYDQLRERLKGQDPTTFVAFTFEPLADLLEISGYAKVYAEFYQQAELWDVTTQTWDRYFERAGQVADWLRHLVAVSEIRKSIFGLKPRDLVRTSWQQDLQGRLVSEGYMEDWLGRGMLSQREGIREHSSLVIRALCRGSDFIFDEAENVFFATYLRQRPEAKDLTKWPAGSSRFEEALEREKRPGSEANTSDRDEL